MKTVNRYSRLTAIFTLKWDDLSSISHQDSLWTNQVNMWRDHFPGNLAEMLIGRSEGDSVHIGLRADEFIAPYSDSKRVWINKDKFRDPGSKQALVAIPGRYYPQGFLHGVSGIFTVSSLPALCVASEGDSLLFDLNHPLAGCDLELSVSVEEIQDDTVERGGRCEDWLERICADGPGMQARRKLGSAEYFSTQSLQRIDTSPDSLFYQKPRMVQHLDRYARETISRKYKELVGCNGKILDLMASWDSHLPKEVEGNSLTVLGLNQQELEANSRASERVVQDLNEKATLPFPDKSFEAVLCTASVEYNINLQTLFSEIHRVLVPGGVVAIAFSNRWFDPKAIEIWRSLHEFERLGMVLELFQRTGGFHNSSSMSLRGKPRPVDDPHQEYMFSDPVYMAWSYKKG